MKTIWGNTVVKNEDRYIWFAIKSVINHLDKLLIYDTGSSDKTVEIISGLKKEYPEKIIFEEKGNVDAKGLTKLRNEMLEKTEADWFILVDGDEVWWEDSITEVIRKINESDENLYAIVNPVINLIGDIYHYQEDAAGEYKILGKKGHFNIRAINRKIPGLNLKNDYPLEGYYDENDKLIQSLDNKLKLADKPILHFSHLQRSSHDDSKNTLHRRKVKLELGKKFPKDFKYPEAFYLGRLTNITDLHKKKKLNYSIRASVITQLKKIKRRLR